MMVTNHSNKSPFRSAVIASSVALFAVLLIFIAIFYAQGVFASKEIVSATVTYDADPYNEGQSDPHTYTITDAEDIAFLTETLKEIQRLPGGVNCGYRQVVLHVVYDDGRRADYYPAGDSCPTITIKIPIMGKTTIRFLRSASMSFESESANTFRNSKTKATGGWKRSVEIDRIGLFDRSHLFERKKTALFPNRSMNN